MSAACTRRRGSAQRCPDARREACDADATAVGLYAIGRVEAVGALVVVGDASGAVASNEPHVFPLTPESCRDAGRCEEELEQNRRPAGWPSRGISNTTVTEVLLQDGSG